MKSLQSHWLQEERKIMKYNFFDAISDKVDLKRDR